MTVFGIYEHISTCRLHLSLNEKGIIMKNWYFLDYWLINENFVVNLSLDAVCEGKNVEIIMIDNAEHIHVRGIILNSFAISWENISIKCVYL